jgi:C1A family cysteine protease
MTRKYTLKRDKLDERDLLFSSTMNVHVETVLPSSVDLRHLCPPVYDQGQEGSCTANAGCAYRSMLLNKADLMFSRQFLYHMERVIEGTVSEDAGATIREICNALHKYGVCEENFMPYVPANLFADPSKDAMDNAVKYKVGKFARLTSINEIKQYLALKQSPVLMGMEVYASMESYTVAKTGILPLPKAGEENMGGHAVLIVGYVDAKPATTKKKSASKGYFIVRNSWGADWGQEGYFMMPYEYIEKGFAFDFWTMEN